jgi:hypothetical protein
MDNLLERAQPGTPAADYLTAERINTWLAAIEDCYFGRNISSPNLQKDQLANGFSLRVPDAKPAAGSLTYHPWQMIFNSDNTRFRIFDGRINNNIDGFPRIQDADTATLARIIVPLPSGNWPQLPVPTENGYHGVYFRGMVTTYGRIFQQTQPLEVTISLLDAVPTDTVTQMSYIIGAIFITANAFFTASQSLTRNLYYEHGCYTEHYFWPQ